MDDEDDVVSLEEERSNREDTDPHRRIDRLELISHRDRIAALERGQAEILDLIRKIAVKIGAA